jgi:hypothetical protein
MHSPFPGMDPYLEDPGGWAGVHDALIAIMREMLNRQLGPGFIADGGTSVYILSPEERRWMYPDVFVIETPVLATASARQGTIAAPLRINIAAPETISQPSILIRDRASREVITVLELLSPVNKGSEGATRPWASARAEFLRKRREVMQSPTHWLEIDLLRAGERPPEVRDLSAYYALLKRGGSTELEVWPCPLREQLRTIAVPLTPPHEDVPLDLQAAIDTLFERYRYAELLDYLGAPPPPSLVPDDARWVVERTGEWLASRPVVGS